MNACMLYGNEYMFSLLSFPIALFLSLSIRFTDRTHFRSIKIAFETCTIIERSGFGETITVKSAGNQLASATKSEPNHRYPQSSRNYIRELDAKYSEHLQIVQHTTIRCRGRHQQCLQ